MKIEIELCCEWCDTPLEEAKTPTLHNDGKIRFSGRCPKCRCVMWSFGLPPYLFKYKDYTYCGQFVVTDNVEKRQSDEILPAYSESDPEELWWCNSHERIATHLILRKGMEPCHVCDPKLGGILLPCKCVNLTGIAEVYAS